MSTSRTILFKSFAVPFYRQNAGQFIFIFIIFFGAVGEIGGKAEYMGPIPQLHYQYALILGMLSSPIPFSLLFLAWLIYMEKCMAFTLSALRKQEYSFVYILNTLKPAGLFRLLLFMQFQLFLPVIGYSLAVIGVAIYKGWYLIALVIPVYVMVLCLISAGCYQVQLKNPGKLAIVVLPRLLPAARLSGAWWVFFLRYACRERKLLLTSLKLFSCGGLYAFVTAGAGDGHDLRMPLLFFYIGMLGHGKLIYHFRELEEQRLTFYRGLPVALARRFAQYAVLYFMLLLPELAIIGLLINHHSLRIADVPGFILPGYGLLLLMNSLLFVAPITMKDFLKLCLLIFGILYFAVLAGYLIIVSVVLFIVAFAFFFNGYYNYEN